MSDIFIGLILIGIAGSIYSVIRIIGDGIKKNTLRQARNKQMLFSFLFASLLTFIGFGISLGM